MASRANPGEQQNLRGTDGPGGEDDLITLYNESLAAAFQFHPGGPVAVEQDAVDQAVGAYGQVQAVAGLVQVAHGSADADAVGVVQGRRPYAVSIRVVVVGTVGVAGGPGSVVEGLLGRHPVLALEAVHHYWAIAAMEIVAAVVRVRLNLAEIGQHVGVGPFVVAEGCPGIVVLGHAPQEYLAVDGAGPAGNLAPGHHHRRGLVGGPADELPVMVAGHHVGLGGVAELHLLGQILEVRIVGPGLQQQHGLGRILGEPGCQDCARGTGANNHVVILHRPTSRFDISKACTRMGVA